MKHQFAIFGLERISTLEADHKKSGQPYLFRKYPKYFDSSEKAYEELRSIINGHSPYEHYKFGNYVVLEIIPATPDCTDEKNKTTYSTVSGDS